MAEGGSQTCPSDSGEDRSLQELEKELKNIQAQIDTARTKQDKRHEMRKKIEAARKELAAITSEENRGNIEASHVNLSDLFL